MRKAAGLILALVLLMSGCTKEEKLQNSAAAFRTSLQTAAEIACTMEIRTHGTELAEVFTLDCLWKPEETVLSVCSPAEIAGVGAMIENKELKLTFDGVILDAGSSPDGVTALTAPSVLAETLRDGHLLTVWEEEREGTACLTMDLIVEDDLRLRVWVEKQKQTPLAFEVYRGETAVLSGCITEWSVRTD